MASRGSSRVALNLGTAPGALRAEEDMMSLKRGMQG